MRAGVLVATLILVLSSVASADTPLSAMTAAIQRASAARTAHVELTQTLAAPGRSVRSSVSGTLAHGDQDLVTSSEGGASHRIAVGQSVYQRRPDTAGAPWTASTRTAPASDLAFGTLTLADGTSLADPKLYRNAQDLGTEQIAQGLARKISADVDMAAIAAAMQLSAGDQARLAAMQGSVTLWLSTTDGTLMRHELVITIPGADGSRTVDTTIDVSDVDGALIVTAP